MGKVIHGATRTPMYSAWKEMYRRTRRPDRHPGHAGVKVDPRWSTFRGFVANPPTVPDGHLYAPGMNLSRVGDQGDYTPENARWRTRAENTREANERRMPRLDDGRFAADVARSNGISSGKLHWRIHAGWSLEAACAAPPHGTRTAGRGRGTVDRASG